MMKKIKNILKLIVLVVFVLLLSLLVANHLFNKDIIAAYEYPATEESVEEYPTEDSEWRARLNQDTGVVLKHLEYPKFKDLLPAERLTDDGYFFISAEDLHNYESIYCCMRGVSLPGQSDTIVRSGGKETDTTDQGKKTAYLREEDIKEATVFKNEAEWTPWTTEGPNNPFEPTTSKTYGLFGKEDKYKILQATPAEAWVLLETDNNIYGEGEATYSITSTPYTGEETNLTQIGTTSDGNPVYQINGGGIGEEEFVIRAPNGEFYMANRTNNGGGYAYPQYAWWEVKTVGKYSSGSEGDEGLIKEAEYFEQYVLRVNGYSEAKVTRNDDGSLNPDLPRNENGTFKINYEVSMTPTDAKEIKVVFDASSNKYRIGPFTVKYERAAIESEPREKVDFAGISSSLLVGVDGEGNEVLDDDGESVFKLKENYQFIYENQAAHDATAAGFYDTEDDYPYPYSEEVFYLEADYLEEVVAFKNLKFDFHYTTASGEFEYTEGEYLIIKWEPVSQSKSRGSASTSTSSTTSSTQPEMQLISATLDDNQQIIPTDRWINLRGENSSRFATANYESIGELKGKYESYKNFDEQEGWAENISGSETMSGALRWNARNIMAKREGTDTVVVSGLISKANGWGTEWVYIRDITATGDYSSGSINWSASPGEDGNKFEYKIKTDLSMPYNKYATTLVVKGTNGTTLTCVIHVTWYNSILNHTGDVGTVKLGVEKKFKDRTTLDNNTKIYYQGVLKPTSITLDFDAQKPGLKEVLFPSGNFSSGIVYAIRDGVILEKSSGDDSQFYLHGSGKMGLTYPIIEVKYTSPGSESAIERITLNSFEVPDMSIEEKDRKEAAVNVGDEQGCTKTLKLYNAFAVDGQQIVDNHIDLEYGKEGYYDANLLSDDGKYEVSRGAKGRAEADETFTITDGLGKQVKVKVTWKGYNPTPIEDPEEEEEEEEDNTGSPNTTPQTPDTSITGVTGERSYLYYLIADEFASNEAQAQANACGGREKVDVSAANGLADSDYGYAVELELLKAPIDLRAAMGGMVWIDQDSQKDETTAQKIGIYEEGKDKPAAKNSVEIVVWKVKYEISSGKEIERQKAIAWDKDNKVIDFLNTRLYVDENGKYDIPYIQVPTEEGLDVSKYVMSYDVEFVYDGQTYEATEYLVPDTGENKTSVADKLEEFKKTPDETEGPDKDYTYYDLSSYVVENADERKQFDAYFSEIYGGEKIDNTKVKEATNQINADREEIDVQRNGGENLDVATKGKATGGKGGSQYEYKYEGIDDTKEASLTYSGQLFSQDGVYKKTQSDLITHDADGYVLKQFRFAARTSEGGLRLPYETQYHMRKEYYDNIIFINKKYKPVDEYFHQINLGLLERHQSDISVNKDLYLANVVVNEQLSTYTYNKLGQITDEALKIQETIGYRSQKYRLDLYNSDYYYRSSAYESISDEITKEILTAIKDGTELQAFLTYRIQFTNSSAYTNASINEFTDYYDSTFTLVTDELCDNVDGKKYGSEVPTGDTKYEPGKFKKYISSQKTFDEGTNSSGYEDLETREALTVGYTPYYRKLGNKGQLEKTDTNLVNGTTNGIDYYWNRDDDLNKEKVETPIDTTGIIKTDDTSTFKMSSETITDGNGKTYKSFTYTGLNAYQKPEDGDPTLNGNEGDDDYNPLVLEPQETIEFFVTFIVDQEGFIEAADQTQEDARQEATRDTEGSDGRVNVDEDAVRSSLVGEKSNIVEITKYSTAYNYKNTPLKKRHNTVRYNNYQISGRVDRDSAPNNINFTLKDVLAYTEDDTEFAPVIDVEVQNIGESRSLNGYVWEDKRGDNELGNGIFGDEDTTIDGIDVTMVEKISVTTKDLMNKIATGDNDLGGFDLSNLAFLDNEFEYIWKHDQLPEFESRTKSNTVEGKKGYYEFDNFVAGNYVVRFEYGNYDYQYEYELDGSGNPVKDKFGNPKYKYEFKKNADSEDGAYYRIIKYKKKADGTYELDEHGNKIPLYQVDTVDLKYNGSDYKNVAYQVSKENGTVRLNPDPANASEEEKALIPETNDTIYLAGKSTLNNEWHDLSKNKQAKSIAEDRVSDARDYEPQRMRAIAYARTITNGNAEAIASGMTTKDGQFVIKDVLGEVPRNHVTDEYLEILSTKQFEHAVNTRMSANTAKFHVSVENPDSLAYRAITSSEGVSEGSGTAKVKEGYDYQVDNIDFGLVERPETRIQLRKEVKGFNMYNKDGSSPVLQVECDDDGNIIKNEGIRVDKVAEIHKDNLGKVQQGFKYIAMESSFLNGLSLVLTYKITVENLSEVDYYDSSFVNWKNKDDIYNMASYYESVETEKAYDDGNDFNIPFATGRGIAYGKYIGIGYYTNNDGMTELYTNKTASSTFDKVYAGTKEDGTAHVTYGKLAVVTTTVDQLVDYIDNDIQLDEESKDAMNQDWNYTSVEDRQYKLSLVSYEDNTPNELYSNIKDNKGRLYVTTNNGEIISNNIVLSENTNFERKDLNYYVVAMDHDRQQPLMTSGKEVTFKKKEGDTEVVIGTNIKILTPTLGTNTIPNVYTTKDYVVGNEPYRDNADLTEQLRPQKSLEGETGSKVTMAVINIVVSKGTSDEGMDNMNYDNLAELLMYSNTAGRRDMQVIPGNANMIAKANRAYEAGYSKYVESVNVAGNRTYGWAPHTVSSSTISEGAIREIVAERDAYAARDTITFSEPTGLNLERQTIDNVIRIIMLGLIMAMMGVIIATVAIVVKKTQYDDSELLDPEHKN